MPRRIGSVEIAGTIMGTLLGVGGVIAMLVLMGVNISSVSAEIQHNIGRVGSLDIAHAVEGCLANGEAVIPETALERAAGSQALADYVQAQCGRGIPAGTTLRAQDVETGESWSAGYAADAKKRDQTIAVVIEATEGRHVGLLTVQVA